MTPTLKEQLEQYIERASNDSVEKWFKDNGWVATESKVIPSVAAYKAGANEMKELLLIACEALQHYSRIDYETDIELPPCAALPSGGKMRFWSYLRNQDEGKTSRKALAEIQEKIKGE